ncbi:hypothetical protein ACPPVO_34175 [Dactylosporangium sp. McL0621]|uniref:hypothetical protein n=1 Tax=Dactylosporangium sp. McL0621 TaxID=3415678 RepID=UPI003CE81FD9
MLDCRASAGPDVTSAQPGIGGSPITSALADLQGQFVANQNLIAAAALIAATPTLVVYGLLDR